MRIEQKDIKFIFTMLICGVLISLLPRHVSNEFNECELLFYASSLLVIYLICDGINSTSSLVSGQALIGLIWLLRYFIPNFFLGNFDNTVLVMVGMTKTSQFQIASIVVNIATSVTLATTSLFGPPPPIIILPRSIPWFIFSTVALFLFLLGAVALSLFLIVNTGSLSETLLEGNMRSTRVIAGSGYLWYLGLAVIPSAVVFAYCQFQRAKCFSWGLWIPAIMAFLTLAPLGGRVRALLPLASVGILYLRKRNLDRPTLKGGVVVAAGVLMLLIYLPVGMAYRSGGISEVFQMGFANFVDYALWSIPGELGQLHGPYIALAHGEGLLEGETYSVLLWPFNDFLSLTAKNTGVLIKYLAVENSIYTPRGAFHPSLIGDAILNFGRWFILVKFFVFGALIGWVQSRHRFGVLSYPISILSIIGLVRAFSESTEKIPEVYVYFGMSFAILAGARLLNKRF